MEIVRSLGQIPLMFIGGILFIVVMVIVWGVAQARLRRNVRDL